MIISIFRTMMLAILRDRGAFVMAFVLPPLIYVIFAAIFSVAAGGDLRVKIAVLDEVRSANTMRLATAIRTSKDFRDVDVGDVSEASLVKLVRTAEIDAAIIIRRDPDQVDRAVSPIKIIGDSSRNIAVPIATGHVLRLFSEALPDVAFRQSTADLDIQIGGLTREQRARIDARIAAMKRESENSASERNAIRAPLVDSELVKQAGPSSSAVVYYAGAVSFMFLLFSAAQGAVSVIDERESGIIERMAAQAQGVYVIVVGKFLFLWAQGILQTALIFIIASIAYGVDLAGHLFGWIVVTFAAAACAASFGLALSTSLRTRSQATTMANFSVLVMSAVGGSMVPRFLMPPWLQDFSWITPSAWAIEAYNRLLWQDLPIRDVAVPIAVLFSIAAFGLVYSIMALGRSIRQ